MEGTSKVISKSVAVAAWGAYNKLIAESKGPNALDCYRIVCVKDPGCMLVRRKNSMGWDREFQDTYMDVAARGKYLVKSARLFRQHLYAHKDPTTGLWYRVRVESLDFHRCEAIVVLIDTGLLRYQVKFEDLLELDPKFWSYPGSAIKVKLSSIHPPGNETSWPLTSKRKLKDLCPRGQIVYGLLLDEPTTRESPPAMLMASFSHGSTDMVLLQQLLVESGCAQFNEGYLFCKNELNRDFFSKHAISDGTSFPLDLPSTEHSAGASEDEAISVE